METKDNVKINDQENKPRNNLYQVVTKPKLTSDEVLKNVPILSIEKDSLDRAFSILTTLGKIQIKKILIYYNY